MSASRVHAFTTGFSGQSFVFHFSYPARPKVGHEFSWLHAFHADDVSDALSSDLCYTFRVRSFPSLFTNEKIFQTNFSTVSTYRNLFVERSWIICKIVESRCQLSIVEISLLQIVKESLSPSLKYIFRKIISISKLLRREPLSVPNRAYNRIYKFDSRHKLELSLLPIVSNAITRLAKVGSSRASWQA